MRVVAGSSKGKRLCVLTGLSIRPTSDKVRESIFNILGQGFQFNRVLDLFAGTGAMGIEALSRGAEGAVFVDKDDVAVKIIKKNLDICGFEDRAKVIKMDVIRALSPLIDTFRGGLTPSAFDLIFIDPPYKAGLTDRTLEMIDKDKLLAHDGIVVLETSKRTVIDARLSGLKEFDKRRYGDTIVTFYRKTV